MPADGGIGPLTFLEPAGIACDGKRLALADAGHNRVLIWDELPTGPGSAPSRVLGQWSMGQGDANAGGAEAASLSGPEAVRFVSGQLFVSDRRERTVRDAGAPLSATGLRSAVLVPYTGGPALAAPAALTALPGRLYLTDPPADRVVVIGPSAGRG